METYSTVIYKQIKNPDTQKYIYVDGRTYNKLLETYDEKMLLNQPSKITHKAPKSKTSSKSPKTPSKTPSKSSKTPSKSLSSLKSSTQTNISILPEIQQEIAHQSDIKTLLNLCQTNKEMNEVCQTKYFWDEQFKIHGLPTIKGKNYTLKGWVTAFKHAYNASLLAKYLQNKNFEFKLDYHYGGTEDVMDALKKLKIRHKKLKANITMNQ